MAGKLDEGSFNYVGFQIMQDNQGITISQSHYVKSMDEITVTPERSSQKNDKLSQAEEFAYWSLVEQINWAVQGTCLDLVFERVDLSTKFKNTHSFLQGWNPPPPFYEGTPSPLSGYPPLSDANLKSCPPLSESHPTWCMQIVRSTLKSRCYVLYYTKSIENIISITFYFQAQLFIYYWHFLWLDIAFNVFIFDMQEEWTWNNSNN